MANLQGELDDKEGDILELTEKVETLQEENEGLRQDLRDYQNREITQTGQIVEVQFLPLFFVLILVNSLSTNAKIGKEKFLLTINTQTVTFAILDVTTWKIF